MPHYDFRPPSFPDILAAGVLATLLAAAAVGADWLVQHVAAW